MRTVLPMICVLVATGATLTGAAQEHGGASHGAGKPATAKGEPRTAPEAGTAPPAEAHASAKAEAHPPAGKATAHVPAAHGDAKPEAAVRPHGTAPDAAVRTAGEPRPASAQELDAVLARISKKIASLGLPRICFQRRSKAERCRVAYLDVR